MISKIGAISLKIFIFLIFVATATLSLLFAKGFRFNPEQREFFYTGVLSISSLPKNSAIFINDKFYGFTSEFLRGIPIDKVNIRIEKGEYHTWQKNIEIDKEIITKANPILAPKNPDYYISDIALAKNVLVDEEERGFVIYNPNLKIIRTIDFIQEKESIYELAEKAEKIFFDKKGVLNILFKKGSTSFEVFQDKEKLPPQPYASDKHKISANGKYLLIIRGNDLWKYSIKDDQSILIKRFNDKIQDAFWFTESDSVLIVKNESIGLIDCDGANEFFILTKDKDSKVYFWGKSSKIVFRQNEAWKYFSFKEN